MYIKQRECEHLQLNCPVGKKKREKERKKKNTLQPML